MDTTGLLGATSTRSASAMASSDSRGRARASPIPTCSTASASGTACSRTQYSWKCTVRRPAAPSRDGHVGLDPVVGHRPQRQPRIGQPACAQPRRRPRTGSARRPATGCDTGGWPRRCRRARTSGSAPYAVSSSRDPPASPSARPQPRSGSMPPPRAYIIVSRSGQIRSPYMVMSSAVLTITVSRRRGRRAERRPRIASHPRHRPRSRPAPGQCSRSRRASRIPPVSGPNRLGSWSTGVAGGNRWPRSC